MKYLLDTNAVSALMKGEPNVLARLRHIAPSDIGMPQPVVAEIAYGIQRLPRWKRREGLASRFERLKDEIQRAPWSDEVSEAFGSIKSSLEKKGQRIEDFDAAVAAHAIAMGAVLVTANIKHLLRVAGIQIEDWSLPLDDTER